MHRANRSICWTLLRPGIAGPDGCDPPPLHAAASRTVPASAAASTLARRGGASRARAAPVCLVILPSFWSHGRVAGLQGGLELRRAGVNASRQRRLDQVAILDIGIRVARVAVRPHARGGADQAADPDRSEEHTS